MQTLIKFESDEEFYTRLADGFVANAQPEGTIYKLHLSTCHTLSRKGDKNHTGPGQEKY
jgi:hypothetical protein